MTDQTPATEAGRRLVAFLGSVRLTREQITEADVKRAPEWVAAIEAEARANALREAADAVRALMEADHRVLAQDCYAAVLAILDPETTP